jgi:predicted DNA-binding transcriptional regulator YafY
MAKFSLAEAARRFEVSRPTLQKDLSSGKISGTKILKDGRVAGWKIDEAELARVYKARDLPDRLTPALPAGASQLEAEIRLLQARLEAAEALAEERRQHLDDLRKLLERPAAERRKRWWPF